MSNLKSRKDKTQKSPRVSGARPFNPSGVDDYITSRPKGLRNLWWGLLTLGIFILLVWQAKYILVEKYAQHQTYRRYLEVFCRVATCQLLPMQDTSLVILTSVAIDLHPVVPDAILVNVKLVNEAAFAQPYPNLQLTLTDRAGRIVGRRTFLPDDYLAEGQHNMLGIGEFGAVKLELAHPHKVAVGFSVNVARATSG